MSLSVRPSSLPESERAGSDFQAKEAVYNRLLTAMSLLVRNEALASGEPKRVLQATTRMGAMTLDTQRVSVWYFDPERTCIVCADLFDAVADTHFDGTRLMASDYPAYFAEINRGRIVGADDAMNDPRTCEFAKHYLGPLGITSMMDVPIKLESRYAGVLCYEHTGPQRVWQPEEKQFALFQSSLLSLSYEFCLKLGHPDPLHGHL